MRIIVLLVAALATAAHAQISVLYEFGSKSGDPLNPQYSGIIAQGRDGNLYSTAPKGGANGYGAVFKITPKGAFSVLYSFDAIHGSSPTGGLTLGMDGNFYGTTTDGGTFGYGTIFKITPGGTLTTLYNFTGGADGKAPTALRPSKGQMATSMGRPLRRTEAQRTAPCTRSSLQALPLSFT